MPIKDHYINEHIREFMLMMVAERGAADNTLDAYDADLTELYNFLDDRNKEIATAKTEDLREYFSYLKKIGMTRSTTMRKNSSVRQFYNFLFSEEIRTDNPTISIPSPKKEITLPDTLSIEEVDMLLEEAKKGCENEDIRLRAMIELLYASGMRITELVTLKISYFETYKLNNKRVFKEYITIKGKGDKERIVPLNATAIEALQDYLKIRKHMVAGNSRKYVFPSKTKKGEVTHITRHRVYQILKNLAINSGVKPAKVHPHALRHSFASHLLRNGANLKVIQDLMGHADISSTQIYTHVFNDRMANFVKDMHPASKMSLETLSHKPDGKDE